MADATASVVFRALDPILDFQLSKQVDYSAVDLGEEPIEMELKSLAPYFFRKPIPLDSNILENHTTIWLYSKPNILIDALFQMVWDWFWGCELEGRFSWYHANAIHAKDFFARINGESTGELFSSLTAIVYKNAQNQFIEYIPIDERKQFSSRVINICEG